VDVDSKTTSAVVYPSSTPVTLMTAFDTCKSLDCLRLDAADTDESAAVAHSSRPPAHGHDTGALWARRMAHAGSCGTTMRR
jgi:hypothetical protein